MTPEELYRLERITRRPLAFFTLEEFDNESHKVWVKNIKNKNLPPISKPASEATPNFYPISPCHHFLNSDPLLLPPTRLT